MVVNQVRYELIQTRHDLNHYIETSFTSRSFVNSLNGFTESMINEITETVTTRINNIEETIRTNYGGDYDGDIIDMSPIEIINSVTNQELINRALDDMNTTNETNMIYTELPNERVLYNTASDKYEKMVRILNKNTTEVDNTDTCCICMDNTNTQQLYKCNGCSFISHTKCIVQAINHAGSKCPQCKRDYKE